MGGRVATEGRTVEQQVLESNPVLEAFGNAKTVRNNNSSRFGKFVEIQFDKFGRISGAAIRTYLLERSRVCQISDPERNYHCFYLLCAAPPEDIEKYKLGNPKSFHYLNQSNCYELVGVNDADDYLATRKAMGIVGISEQEQEAIFRVVAAILHLGNIDFSKGAESDSAVLKDEQSKFHLEMTAELLMCNSQSLEDALCKRVMITREEVITKTLDPLGATVSRDGLAKTIYSRLFDWLVDKINVSIGQDPNSKYLIGVLDIYGFESFNSNSFEQFCINFTNEKLQQHFNQHVFKMEQEEYRKEQIDWSYVEFVDNQDVLDLIEKKSGGIIALLDEACMFPKSTHETFCQRLYQTFKSHKRFIKPKLSHTEFAICHYAGEVMYQSDQFLDKNKDYVVAEHQDLLSASKCLFVSGLFPPIPEETTKSSKFSSIGSRFKLQLQSLIDTLNSTEPHYIRCVKPNNLLKPSIFENVNIIQQLRCGGVLEATRIRCAGYPTRKTLFEFLRRFGVLAPEIWERNYDEKVACRMILDKGGLEGYQIGKTKVFLRVGQMGELDALRGKVLGTAAESVQRRIRSYIARKRFITMKKASIQVQSLWKRKVACKLYERMRKDAAAVKIQKNLRRHQASKTYNRLQLSVLVLQAGLRGMTARNEFRFRRKRKAITVIQKQWRCHRDCSCYKKQKSASIIIQCRLRGKIARKDLRKLKQAARETGALKEAKEKLEKQVEELTRHLELEKRLRMELGEEKEREIMMLRNSLKVMEDNVYEMNAMLAKEQEAAGKAIEEAPPVFKAPILVQNTKKMGSPTAEVEHLMKWRGLSSKLNAMPTKEREAVLKAIEEAPPTIKAAPILVQDTERISSLTEEVECLKKWQGLSSKLNAMPTKEREAVLKAIEEAPPAIKEAPILVQDTERIGSLPKEVEYLKDIEILQLQEAIKNASSFETIVQVLLAERMVAERVEKAQMETKLECSHDMMELHFQIKTLERDLEAYKRLCESFLAGKSIHKPGSPSRAGHDIEHFQRELSESSISRLVVLLPVNSVGQAMNNTSIPVSLTDVLVSQVGSHYPIDDGGMTVVDDNVSDGSRASIASIDGDGAALAALNDGTIDGDEVENNISHSEASSENSSNSESPSPSKRKG
eukprot:TRINITY_DN6144_c0_g1_i2.p1 TRINITY_DN6144_c0_g1~~TRINITY_DN6144_c0_g1_i2.p1  ORF type:complete len:1265 (-),score=311.33 TRINITY_DN6144_c0_g1_i2:689-4090(-)